MIRTRLAGLLLLGGVLGASPCAAQDAPLQLPFRVGETLTYQARVGRLAGGSGELRVDGPENVRGRDTYLFRFAFRGRMGPVSMEGDTRSWFDPEAMASLRFQKRERTPLSSKSEAVELFPAQRTWRNDDGREGSMPTSAPLDELSYLYYVRTLPLASGATYRLDRHFDPARNPTVVRVVGRERIQVPAGTFSTVVVEMQVHDGGHFGGGGVIRIHLTDDAWRVPVRIESSLRLLGRVVLDLRSCNRHVGGVAMAVGAP